MGIGGFLKVGKYEASGNVNEEYACRVMARRFMATHCVWETRTASNHLINAAHFTGVKWVLTNWLGFSQGMVFGFSILTFST